MLSLIRQLLPSIMAGRGERGVTTVEYAIMLVLIAIAVAGFGSGLSGSVTGAFRDLITELQGGGGS